MKTWGYIAGAIVLVFGVFGFGYSGSGKDVDGLKIASFNGQVFGDAKIEKVEVDYYVDLILDYDLFFLLEIRDADGSSFDSVCLELEKHNYSCLVSERAGRSSSKEQVGVVWDEVEVNVSGVWSVMDDEDLFEREPVVVESSLGEFWVVYLKPANVSSELEALELAVDRRQKAEGIVVIGDLNADCGYYDNSEEGHFEDWVWWVGDDVDTTTGATDCAYDRVISRGVDVLGCGVVEVDGEVSDHNLVWVEVTG